MKKILFVFIPFFITPVFAQIVIVVTPNKIPINEEQTATTTTVISQEEIEQSQKLTVADVLDTVPGLYAVSQGGLGKQTSVFLRGAKSEHTLVFIDGVEVNDPSSPTRGFDFANLSLENIERIEIVRGPQSVLYGSDAIGGVIQIFTKKSKFKNFTSRNVVSGGYGSFQTHQKSIDSLFGDEKYSVSFGISHLETQGISSSDEDDNPNAEKDGYELTTLQSNIQLTPTSSTTLQLFGRYQISSNEIDDFGGPGGDDPNFLSDENDLYSGFKLKTQWKFYHPEIGLSFSHIHRKLNDQPNATDPGIYVATFKGRNVKPTLLHQFVLNPQNTILVGNEYEREDFDSTSNFGDSPNVSAYTFGNFLQQQFINSFFHESAGIRIEQHQVFGTNVTYKISPGFTIPRSKTTLNFNYATGFKAPSLFQLYDTFSGNPALKPDKSRSFDISLEQKIVEQNLIGVTYFNNHFNETIEYDFTTSTYQNIGESSSHGLEFYIQAKLLSRLGVLGQWTILRSEDESTGFDLLRRPHNRAELDLQYKVSKRFDVGGSYTFVGSRLDVGNVTLHSYSLIGLRASFQITPSLHLLGRVDNLMNKNYQEVLGFGTPGINWFTTLKFTL